MFSTLPVIAFDFRPTVYYTPQVLSPLSSSPLQPSPPSPRDGNALQRPQLTMSSPTRNKPRKQTSYSKRVTFLNPLIHDHNDGKEARRKLFLRKVRQDSENRKWEARGGDDEMMRTIWVAEQRRHAHRKAREATTYVPASPEEEPERDGEMKNALDHFHAPEDQAMLDDVARFEDAEIEAALSSDLSEGNSQPYQNRNSETRYCSDDEEYDSILMEVIQEVERNAGVEENFVVHDYINKVASKDGKYVSVDTTKLDHDMMDTT